MRPTTACDQFVGQLSSIAEDIYTRVKKTNFFLRWHKESYLRSKVGARLIRNAIGTEAGLPLRGPLNNQISYADKGAISGFKESLKAHGQNHDLYKHIQFVAGNVIIGNATAKAANKAFIAYDYTQGYILGKLEDQTAYQDDLAGLAVGEAFVDSLQSGNFHGLVNKLRSTLCE